MTNACGPRRSSADEPWDLLQTTDDAELGLEGEARVEVLRRRRAELLRALVDLSEELGRVEARRDTDGQPRVDR